MGVFLVFGCSKIRTFEHFSSNEEARVFNLFLDDSFVCMGHRTAGIQVIDTARYLA